MKTNSPYPSALYAGLLLLSALNPQLSTFAQDSLTPPGPPATTFKTLTQVEPPANFPY